MPFHAGFFFVGRFVITDPISLLFMGLFRFSISSWVSFGNLCFSRICPSSLSNLLTYSYSLYSLIFLFTCIRLVVIPQFSFLISVICVPLLFFFLVSLAKGLSILLIFSKKQLLVSLILSVFLFSILFISCKLYYFLPLLALGLVCFSFSSSLNRLLIWELYPFLM